MGGTDLAGSMSVELISVLIAVLAIRATLAGLILTSNHGLRQDMRLLAMVALLAAGCTPNQPTIPDDVSYRSSIQLPERASSAASTFG